MFQQHSVQSTLPGSSHSLSLASPSRGGCAQQGNAGVPCSWMSWTWFTILCHLASITSGSPSGVEAAVQYRWFMMAGLHSFRSSHSLSFAAASKAFPRPVSQQKQNVKKENVIINKCQPNQTYQHQDTYFYQYARYQRNDSFLLDTTPPAPTWQPKEWNTTP